MEATQYALTQRIMIRLAPKHKEILVGLARRRGCSISDLAREAVIGHFSLPTDGSITTAAEGEKYTGSTGEDGVSEKEGAADKGIRGNSRDGQ